MTPEEFDAAAHQLLTAERDGTLRLPMQLGGIASAAAQAASQASGAAAASGPDAAWGDDDENVPLRSPGAPSHFNMDPSGQQPAAPSRRRRGGGAGGAGDRSGQPGAGRL